MSAGRGGTHRGKLQLLLRKLLLPAWPDPHPVQEAHKVSTGTRGVPASRHICPWGPQVSIHESQVQVNAQDRGGEESQHPI